MKSSYQIIKALLRTEKSTMQESQRKYLFLVDKDAGKPQIRKAIQDIYKVKVLKINTLISPGKLKRVRYQYGRTPDCKKAVITLTEGQKIEVS